MKKKLLFSLAAMLMYVSSAFATITFGETTTDVDAFKTAYGLKLKAIAVVTNPVEALTYNPAKSENHMTLNAAYSSVKLMLEKGVFSSETDLDVMLANYLIDYNLLEELTIKINDLKAVSDANVYSKTYQAELEGYYNGTKAVADADAAVAKVKTAASDYAALNDTAKAYITWVDKAGTDVLINKTPKTYAPDYFYKVINSINAIVWLDKSEVKSILGKAFATISVADNSEVDNFKNTYYKTAYFTNTGYDSALEAWKNVTTTNALYEANRIFINRNNIKSVEWNNDTKGTLITNIIAWMKDFGKVNDVVNAHPIYKKSPLEFDYNYGSADYTALEAAITAINTVAGTKTTANTYKIVNGEVPETIPTELYEGIYGRDGKSIAETVQELKDKVNDYDIANKFGDIYRNYRLWADSKFTLGTSKNGTMNLDLAYKLVKDFPVYYAYLESHEDAKDMAKDVCNYDKAVAEFLPKVNHLIEAYNFNVAYKTVLSRTTTTLLPTDYLKLKEALVKIEAWQKSDYERVPVLPIITALYTNEATLIANIEKFIDLTEQYYMTMEGNSKIILDIATQLKSEINAATAANIPWSADAAAALRAVWTLYNAFNTNAKATVKKYLEDATAEGLVYDRVTLMDALSDNDYDVIGAGVYNHSDLVALASGLEAEMNDAELFVARTAKVNEWVADYYTPCIELAGVKENKEELNAAYAVYSGWVKEDAELKNFRFWTDGVVSAKSFYTVYVSPIKSLNDKANADYTAFTAAQKWIEIANEIMENEAVYSDGLVAKIDNAIELYNNTKNDAKYGKLAETGRTYVTAEFDIEAWDEFCATVKADQIGVAYATTYYVADYKDIKNRNTSVKYGNGVEGQEMSWTAFEAYAKELHETNPNAITYVAVKTDRELPVNVIAKDMKNKAYASHIELNDGEPFYIGVAATAAKVTVNKKFNTGKISPWVLPFNVTVGDLKNVLDENIIVRKFNTVYGKQNETTGETTLTMNFYRMLNDTDVLYADKPYTIETDPQTKSLVFEPENGVAITKTLANNYTFEVSSASAVVTLTGIYKQKAQAAGDYVICASNGSLAPAKEGAKIPAGRLVFNVQAKEGIDYVIKMEDVEDELTAIKSVNADSNAVEGIYTISGVKVNSMSQPGLYIVNGKKIMVK